MSINSLPIQGAKQTASVGPCCQLATHKQTRAHTHTHTTRLIGCGGWECVHNVHSVPYRGDRLADRLMLLCWMRLPWIGKHNELPGISLSQTCQLTAIVPLLQSQGTLDRLNWVRLQQQSEGASPQRRVCENKTWGGGENHSMIAVYSH